MRPPLPVMTLLILKVLAGQLRQSSLSGCRPEQPDVCELSRIYAKAECDIVPVEAWRPRPSGWSWGGVWFALRLPTRNAPLPFARGEPFRVMACVEAMATLLAILVPLSELYFHLTGVRGTEAFGCSTDSQRNAFLF